MSRDLEPPDDVRIMLTIVICAGDPELEPPNDVRIIVICPGSGARAPDAMAIARFIRS